MACICFSYVRLTTLYLSCPTRYCQNHLLPEWLAYHYHVLPLRRLIIGIDPRSETSPTEILDRYRDRGLMKITEWKEEDFMPPHLISQHEDMLETDDVGLKALYIERQFQFYTKCMAYLKHEHVNWTAITDTDEYILANPHADEKFRLQNTTNKTIYELIESNNNIHPMIKSGCISMHRLQFGTKESTSSQVQLMVPPTYNGTDFSTFRWRYHAGFTNMQYNKVAKCLVDVSRISNRLFIPSQVNAHRPSKALCSEDYLRIENRESPFVGYHYAGSWEQWNFRNDFRPKRLRSNYDLLSFDDTTSQDDSIRPWLNNFVQSMGKNLAKELLRDVGRVPPKRNTRTQR